MEIGNVAFCTVPKHCLLQFPPACTLVEGGPGGGAGQGDNQSTPNFEFKQNEFGFTQTLKPLGLHSVLLALPPTHRQQDTFAGGVGTGCCSGRLEMICGSFDSTWLPYT